MAYEYFVCLDQNLKLEGLRVEYLQNFKKLEKGFIYLVEHYQSYFVIAKIWLLV